MFRKSKADRRQGYSPLGHLRRVIATRGTGRVALSLGGTALVAAVAFAHCSGGSGVTGPSTPSSPVTSAPATGNPAGGATKDGGTTSSWGPATVSTITIPVLILPIPTYSPCTKQAIVWDPAHSYTTLTNYLQTSTDPLNPSLRSYNHVLSAALGTTDPGLVLVSDDQWRKYLGSDEHDTQMRVYSTGAEKYMDEWDTQIIAYDHNEWRWDADDFHFHIVVLQQTDPTKTRVQMYAYCNDSDYGWWKNDSHYRDDDDGYQR